jgi:copper/silver efflux system protein
MTFAVTCIGLFPIMWSDGTGSAVMKRIAAPMVGGIATSFMLELLVYPAIYELWRRRSVARMERSSAHLGEQQKQEAGIGMLIAS